MTRLNLVLFGGFRATIGARPLILSLKKAQGLVAFLALCPGQRQRVSDWPHSSGPTPPPTRRATACARRSSRFAARSAVPHRNF